MSLGLDSLVSIRILSAINPPYFKISCSFKGLNLKNYNLFMVIHGGLGKFLNQSSSQTTVHPIKLHVTSINMYRILLLLYDYTVKSGDYIVTNVLWFQDSCTPPFRYRLNFNSKIKERMRTFFNHCLPPPRSYGFSLTSLATSQLWVFFSHVFSCL